MSTSRVTFHFLHDLHLHQLLHIQVKQIWRVALCRQLNKLYFAVFLCSGNAQCFAVFCALCSGYEAKGINLDTGVVGLNPLEA